MRRIGIENLRPGMRLFFPVRDDKDNILLNRDVELDERYIRHLKRIGFKTLYVLDPGMKDIVFEDIISDQIRAESTRHAKRSYKIVEEHIDSFKDEPANKIIKYLQSPDFKKAFCRSNLYNNTVRIADDIVVEVISNSILPGFNTLKTADSYTFNHSFDATIVAIMIGRRLKFNVRKLKELAVGCLLHDVGTSFIPQDILNKGKFNRKEYELLKEHTVFGYELLKECLPIMPTHIAYQHHERQDGKGYPRGLTGTNTVERKPDSATITIFGEIATIADVYDALVSDRPFRKSILHDKALGILEKNKHTHFNAEILDFFLGMVPRYPVGFNCEIIEGEYLEYKGVVIALNPDSLNTPVIRILYNPEGKRVKPFDLDLKKEVDSIIELTEDLYI
jgi:HD-GYP domain-containing protein (c-di-GMP phosphodiesterase class II)